MNNKAVKISKAGIGYTVGNYLIRGLGFLTIPIFSRILSPADYGVFNTYSAYESILFIIVGLALHTSFKNAKLKFQENFEDYISSCVLLLVFNTFILFLLLNIFVYLFDFSDHFYITVLVLHSFSSAIIGYYNTYLSIYYQSKSYIKLALFNAIGNITISILLILTVFNDNRGIGRIIGNYIPYAISGAYLIYYFWKKHKPKIKRNYWKYALGYSLPLVPHGISQVLLSSFDRIMITSMIGSSESGVYSFAYNIYAIISVTYSSLDQVWSPWFYEKKSENALDEIRDKASKYVFGMALFTLGVMLVSPEIVYIMGTDEYYDSVYLLVPVILGGFFSFLYSFPAIIEYYYEKTKYIMLGTMLAAVINILLNYVFIKQFGYVAAAYTTLATYILYFLFHYIISVRINKGHLYDLKVLIFIILMMLFSGIITQMVLPYMVFRWLLGIIDAIVLLIFINKQFLLVEWIKNRIGV